ncbi:MAG: hypothetical protein DMF95_07660 [Acidobacteria bacterium]|nr:MAG: hypothetical protein DMF94_12575 [Acidobacteriota bacterium]PYR51859.1 MAG: hypothetical protein DMF95_07660 [Acidobacteriota bacterium]
MTSPDDEGEMMAHAGVAEGTDAMAKEEAAYWLGMAMHRRRPRRVLPALRCLLVEQRYFRPRHSS